MTVKVLLVPVMDCFAFAITFPTVEEISCSVLRTLQQSYLTKLGFMMVIESVVVWILSTMKLEFINIPLDMIVQMTLIRLWRLVHGEKGKERR
jgi:hypothetical protein